MSDKVLTKKNEQASHETFPIKRKKKDEYHIYMGFDTQAAAEKWIDWGIKTGFLARAQGLETGAPAQPHAIDVNPPPPRPVSRD